MATDLNKYFVNPSIARASSKFNLSELQANQRISLFHNIAREITQDEEAAAVMTAIAMREGGLHGGVGDKSGGGSYGPLQFYMQGELPGFARWLGVDTAKAGELARDPVQWGRVVKYAWEGYLGNAIRQGRTQGLSGPQLAMFASQTGQRSVKPERSAQMYTQLLGQTGGEPAQAGPTFPDDLGRYFGPSQAVEVPPYARISAGQPGAILGIELGGPAGAPTPTAGPAKKPPTALESTVSAAYGPRPESLGLFTDTRGFLKDSGSRALSVLGIPQAAVETLISQATTGGTWGNFEQTEWYQNAVRVLAKWLPETVWSGTIPAVQKASLEDREEMARMLVSGLSRVGTDPTLYIGWANKALRSIGQMFKQTPALLAESARSASLAPSLADVFIPNKPVTVTASEMARMGQVRTAAGQFGKAPAVTFYPKPGQEKAGDWFIAKGYMRGPDGRMRQVTVHYQPEAIRPGAPRPVVRVSANGTLIEVESPAISATRAEAAEVTEIVHTTPGPAQVQQAGVNLPPIAGGAGAGERGSIILPDLERHWLGRAAFTTFSRVGAHLESMGPAGESVSRMFNWVMKDSGAWWGARQAEVAQKFGQKIYPTILAATDDALRGVFYSGKDPRTLKATDRLLYDHMKETIDTIVPRDIVSNGIEGYIAARDAQVWAQRGIDISKGFEESVNGIRVIRLPAEEFVKAFQPGYFPRRYNWEKLSPALEDPAQRKDLIDYLVRTGQAKHMAEADEILDAIQNNRSLWSSNKRLPLEQPIQHFQMPRVAATLPSEFLLGPVDTYERLAMEIGTAIAYQKHLGQDMRLLAPAFESLMSTPGVDKAYVRDAMAYLFGRVDESESIRRLQAWLSGGVALTKMGLSTISQTGQIDQIYTMVGRRNVWKALKAQHEFGYLDAYRAGAVLSPASMATELSMGGTARKFLEVNRFLPMDRYLRSTAFHAGRFLFDDVLEATRRGTRGWVERTVVDHAQRVSMDNGLDLLGAIRKGGDDLLKARDDFGYIISKETQFRGTALDSPLFRRTAQGRLLLTLRSFSFSQAAFVTDRLIKELVVFKNPLPLLRFISWGLPHGMAILVARSLIPAMMVGQIKNWEDIRETVKTRFSKGIDTPQGIAATWYESLMAIGAWGIVSDAARQFYAADEYLRYQRGLELVSGIPTAQAVQVGEAMVDPFLTALHYVTSPPEENAATTFGDEIMDSLVRSGTTLLRQIPAGGSRIPQAIGLEKVESTRRRYLRLIHRSFITGDSNAFVYWRNKLIVDTGKDLDPDTMDEWSKQLYMKELGY